MNIIELSDKVLEQLRWQLLDDVVLYQLYQQVIDFTVPDLLVAWQLGSLLFLGLLFLATTLLFLLFSLLLGEHHHVLKLLIDHLVNQFGFFLFDLRSHSGDSHVTVIGLLLVFGLVTVSPIQIVRLIEAIELQHDFGGPDLCDLVFLLLVGGLLLLLFLFFLFLLLVLVSLLFGFLGSLLLRTERRFQIIAVVEFGDVSRNLAVSLRLLFLDPLAALHQHVLSDVGALDFLDVVFEFHLCRVEYYLVILLLLLAACSRGPHLLDGVVLR